MALLPSSLTQRRYQALVHWYPLFLAPAHHCCQLSVRTDGEGAVLSVLQAASLTVSSPGITKITPTWTHAQPSSLNPEYERAECILTPPSPFAQHNGITPPSHARP